MHSAGAIMPNLNQAEERFETPLLDSCSITETATMVDELAPRWRLIGSIADCQCRVRRARRSLSRRRSLRRRGTDRARAGPMKGITASRRAASPEEAGTHRRPREVGPGRLPDDHRTRKGVDHSRRQNIAGRSEVVLGIRT